MVVITCFNKDSVVNDQLTHLVFSTSPVRSSQHAVEDIVLYYLVRLLLIWTRSIIYIENGLHGRGPGLVGGGGGA